jgi:2-phosphosulfolactate phosphatase
MRTPNRKVVAIDYSDTGLGLEGRWAAVVIVDVIRSATTAITAVTTGRRCFPVPSIEAAVPLAARLDNPLLAGELGGSMPYGFELQNSPARISRRKDIERPLILLSTSGTRLLHEAAQSHVTYAACLRNATAQARHLADHEESVLLLGAATRGEFREEDILCCGRIGRALVEAGYRPRDARTEGIIEDWGAAADDAFFRSASVTYLEATDQRDDLDFILRHIDDLDGVFEVTGDELAMTGG